MLFGRWVYSSLSDLSQLYTVEVSSILLFILIYSTYHGQVWLNDSQIRGLFHVDKIKRKNAGVSPHFLLRNKMGPRQ